MKYITIIGVLLLLLFSGCASNSITGNVVKEQPEIEKVDKMIAVVETNMGTIEIELNKEKAPVTVANFKKYAEEGFYENTIFHRVIKSFMVQGGGFTEDKNQKDTKAPIKLESNNGLTNDRGTIAMARTNVPDSATSQFFINTKDNAFLNYAPGNDGYAVFGKVVKGMDVVDKIEGVKTGSSGPHRDWPTETVLITKVTIQE